jgi:hypothetical protein
MKGSGGDSWADTPKRSSKVGQVGIVISRDLGVLVEGEDGREEKGARKGRKGEPEGGGEIVRDLQETAGKAQSGFDTRIGWCLA